MWNADPRTKARRHEEDSSADFADGRRFQDVSICEICVICGQTLLVTLAASWLCVRTVFEIAPSKLTKEIEFVLDKLVVKVGE
jgi:hypothetical protein